MNICGSSLDILPWGSAGKTFNMDLARILRNGDQSRCIIFSDALLLHIDEFKKGVVVVQHEQRCGPSMRAFLLVNYEFVRFENPTWSGGVVCRFY